MRRMADGSRKHLGSVAIITVYVHNLTHQSNTVFTDVVKTAYKRRNVSYSGFCRQQRLPYGKYQCTVGADTFSRKVFNSFYAVCDAGYFHHDMWIERGEFFTFLNHALVIGSNNLCTDISLHDVADVHIMLTLVFHAFDTFFRHERGIGSHSVEYAHIIGFPNLV